MNAIAESTAVENVKGNPNEFMNAKQIAAYIGVSIRQVQKDFSTYPPPYPFYRVTATKRVAKRADLDAWLEKVKVSAAV